MNWVSSCFLLNNFSKLHQNLLSAPSQNETVHLEPWRMTVQATREVLQAALWCVTVSRLMCPSFPQLQDSGTWLPGVDPSVESGLRCPPRDSLGHDPVMLRSPGSWAALLTLTYYPQFISSYSTCWPRGMTSSCCLFCQVEFSTLSLSCSPAYEIHFLQVVKWFVVCWRVVKRKPGCWLHGEGRGQTWHCCLDTIELMPLSHPTVTALHGLGRVCRAALGKKPWELYWEVVDHV